MSEGGHRLADHDDEHGGQDRPGVVEKARRVEQHADRHEEQHREGVAERQRFLRGAVAELGFAHDHPGKEGAEGQRHAEQLGGAEGDAERDRQHRQAEQLARAGVRHVVQQPGDHPPPDHQHQDDEGDDLGQRQAEHAPQAETGLDAERIGAGLDARAVAAEHARQRRQQHQCQHHRQVFDDQPADGDPPPFRLQQPPLLQRAQQHHGARHREGEAEHQAGARRPAEQPGEPGPQRRRQRDLHDRPRHGDGAHRQQVLEREMQADAEHQQDDAHLGQLQRQMLVGDEAWRVRADQHAGEQIADERRDAEAVGERAEDERKPETGDDGGDQGRVMRHRRRGPSGRQCVEVPGRTPRHLQ